MNIYIHAERYKLTQDVVHWSHREKLKEIVPQHIAWRSEKLF